VNDETKSKSYKTLRVSDLASSVEYEIPVSLMESQILDSRSSSKCLKHGDILISLRCTAFRFAKVGQTEEDCLAYQNILVIRPQSCTLNDYLLSWLASELGQDATTSAEKLVKSKLPKTAEGQKNDWKTKSLNVSDFRSLFIPVPPLHKQKEIVRLFKEMSHLRLKYQTEMHDRIQEFNEVFSNSQ
jgi:restriction endonuclease S subunit